MKRMIFWMLLAASTCIAGQWETLETRGKPAARHEAAFVEFNGEFYLMGGRRIQPVCVFNPENNSWRNASNWETPPPSSPSPSAQGSCASSSCSLPAALCCPSTASWPAFGPALNNCHPPPARLPVPASKWPRAPASRPPAWRKHPPRWKRCRP